MSTLQYTTQVSPEGYIATLPPEFCGRKVVVRVHEEKDGLGKKYGTNQPSNNDWRPDPTAVRRFMEFVESLPSVEITDEEIEQLKHERRMRKML